MLSLRAGLILGSRDAPEDHERGTAGSIWVTSECGIPKIKTHLKPVHGFPAPQKLQVLSAKSSEEEAALHVCLEFANTLTLYSLHTEDWHSCCFLGACKTRTDACPPDTFLSAVETFSQEPAGFWVTTWGAPGCDRMIPHQLAFLLPSLGCAFLLNTGCTRWLSGDMSERCWAFAYLKGQIKKYMFYVPNTVVKIAEKTSLEL